MSKYKIIIQLPVWDKMMDLIQVLNAINEKGKWA